MDRKDIIEPTVPGMPAKVGGSFLGRLLTQLRNAGNLLKMSGPNTAGPTRPSPAIAQSAKSMMKAVGFQKLDLKFANQVLGGVLAGLMILVFYVALSERPDINSVKAAVDQIKFPDMESRQIAKFQDLAVYLDRVQQRDIFNIFEVKKEPEEAKPVEPPLSEPPPPPKVPIQDKAKGLKLIGISWGRNPKAMIRNEKNQEVYFLGIGENIKGTDIYIKDVLQNEVVIISEDDTMSML